MGFWLVVGLRLLGLMRLGLLWLLVVIFKRVLWVGMLFLG